MLVVHPCASSCANSQGAVLVSCAASVGSYRLQGAFARANNAYGAGLAVQGVVFVNDDLAHPLFLASIGPNNSVDPANYFGGTGAATFDVTTPLSQGDCLRVGVFASPHDNSFDATAVKFQITSTTNLTATPTIASVTNVTGEAPTIAQNTWIEIKGTNLAPGMRSWQNADFVNNQMPTQLDRVSVTVNGKSAFVSYISSTQVNILTPLDSAQGPVPVQLMNGSGKSAVSNVQLEQSAPGFFFSIAVRMSRRHMLMGATWDL